MKPNTISEFINALDAGSAEEIRSFIDFMGEEFPQIAPRISYSMPMWWVGKKIYDGYIGISAAAEHYSVHFSSEDTLQRLKEALPACKFGKRCINIRYSDEKSAEVVKQVVRDYIISILPA